MQELDISADMPFSLVISTLRRKRLMTILTSKERNKQEGKDVIATYKQFLDRMKEGNQEKQEIEKEDDFAIQFVTRNK